MITASVEGWITPKARLSGAASTMNSVVFGANTQMISAKAETTTASPVIRFGPKRGQQHVTDEQHGGETEDPEHQQGKAEHIVFDAQQVDLPRDVEDNQHP